MVKRLALGRAGGVPRTTPDSQSRERNLPAAPGETSGTEDRTVRGALLPPGGEKRLFLLFLISALLSLLSAKTKSGVGWMRTPESGDRRQRGAPDRKMHTRGKHRASAYLSSHCTLVCSSLLGLLEITRANLCKFLGILISVR